MYLERLLLRDRLRLRPGDVWRTCVDESGDEAEHLLRLLAVLLEEPAENMNTIIISYTYNQGRTGRVTCNICNTVTSALPNMYT